MTPCHYDTIDTIVSLPGQGLAIGSLTSAVVPGTRQTPDVLVNMCDHGYKIHWLISLVNIVQFFLGKKGVE